MKTSKNERFLELASVISEWSKDPRTKVGAVLVGHKDQIIAQGYNGFPRKIGDTKERLNNREVKNKLVIHAEMNAIYNAIHNGASTEGSTIYISGLPCCHECAKGIIQTGISKVVMDSTPEDSPEPWDKSGKLALELFKEAGVDVEFILNSKESNVVQEVQEVQELLPDSEKITGASLIWV